MALPSFVNVPSMANSADFDSCGCLDKNHAPIADPQSCAWPPCQALDVAGPGFGKPLDLGLYVGPRVWRKLAKLAAGIMGPRDRLHESNISTSDYFDQQNIAVRDIIPLQVASLRRSFFFATELRATAPGLPPRPGIAAPPLIKSPALVAQLDRAPDFESGGRGFESLRAPNESPEISTLRAFFRRVV
jgi:hypothetical protein